jgi:hypothetical protein
VLVRLLFPPAVLVVKLSGNAIISSRALSWEIGTLSAIGLREYCVQRHVDGGVGILCPTSHLVATIFRARWFAPPLHFSLPHQDRAYTRGGSGQAPRGAVRCSTAQQYLGFHYFRRIYKLVHSCFLERIENILLVDIQKVI